MELLGVELSEPKPEGVDFADLGDTGASCPGRGSAISGHGTWKFDDVCLAGKQEDSVKSTKSSSSWSNFDDAPTMM